MRLQLFMCCGVVASALFLSFFVVKKSTAYLEVKKHDN